MSDAIAAGLYHPRCKDQHGTYFDGVSTPPDEGWTAEEVEGVKQQSKEDIRQQNAKRRFEYCDRLANNLLDAGNRRTYAVRAGGWKEIINNVNDTVVNVVKDDIIYEKDIAIHKSLGAKGYNYKVKLPNGDYTRLTEGTKITKIYKFAGKGCKKPLRVADFLAEQVGGKPEDWYHVTGDGFVDVGGESKKAELHWFESKEYGRIKMKVKRWRNES